MKLESLYKQVLREWPEEIDISDGENRGDDGFLSLNLTSTFDKLEKKIGIENPWLEIGNWAFNQALWRNAKNNFTNDQFVVKRSDVTIEEFDKYLRSNLKDESWSKERKEYQKYNS